MKSRISLSFFFISLLFISCGDKEPVKTNPPEPSFTTYPVEVGNHWSYNRLAHVDFEDTVLSFPDSIFSTAYVEVEGIKIINDTTTAYEFVDYHTMDSDSIYSTNVAYTYFTNEDTGFYMHAYRSAGIATPVKNANTIVFNGREFNNLLDLSYFISGLKNEISFYSVKADTTYPSDSLHYEFPPIESLSYPLQVGKEWVYRAESIAGEIHKKVISTESVTTSAGTFSCYKIQFLYLDSDQSTKFEFFDYISSKGLIKRTFSSEVTFTDIEGNVIAVGTFKEDLSLTGYFVQ